MSNQGLNEMKDINSQGNQIGVSSPQQSPSENQMNKKSKIVMGVSIAVVIAAIIVVIVVVVVVKKDDDEDEKNNSRNTSSPDDYYISEEITDSNGKKYRLVNPNVEHYIFAIFLKMLKEHM